jgi:predicted alpha/beta-hydrolase family hydrolase
VKFVAPEKIEIAVSGSDKVTGLVYSAGKDGRIGATLLLGHGAGRDQLSPFMVMFASRLAASGIDTVTFNFVYTERKRRIPDRTDKLESCYRAAIAAVAGLGGLASNKLFIGGKSMGGRIASHIAAQGIEGLSGCVFLGYPLHPPGRPERLRDQHLASITVPMLFMQGSTDTFGTPDELRPIIQRLSARWTLYVIEGGDHSFKVPKKGDVPQDGVYQGVIERIGEWISEITG